MKYGVCLGMGQLDRIRTAAECGFDYVEIGFAELERADVAAVKALQDVLAETGLACEAANGFIPGDIPLTGEHVDESQIRAHVETGMRRAKELGIQVVVFGSGGARSLDENTSFRRGFAQLAEFLGKIAGPIAAQYGIRIAVEPLRPQESNIINRVKEGVMLAAASGSENVGGLGDLFHMASVNDDVENLCDLKGCIFHCHIANPALNTEKPRVYPSDPAEYDYRSFVRAAESAGCPRCSIEAGCGDFDNEALKALAVLRSIRI